MVIYTFAMSLELRVTYLIIYRISQKVALKP